MTTHIRVRNIGEMTLHGRHPGEEWVIAVDDTGRAVNQLWRKRLSDEDKYKVGVIAVVGTELAAQPTPEPDPARAPVIADIGPFLDLFHALAVRVEALETKPPLPGYNDTPLRQDLAAKHTDLNNRLVALERTIGSLLT
jgi:hypothetical protein